ncbi:hypothetical protein ACKWTF_001704 [Chironomus riparius]
MVKKEMEDKRKNEKQHPIKGTKRLNLDLKEKLKIGKVNIVNPKNYRNEFYCSICDVLKHDSLGYQSHMTSKAHMKSIGKDLSVEKSTLAQVRSRLNGNKSEVTTKPRTFVKQKQQVKEEPMSAEQAEIFRAMGFNGFGNKKLQNS